MPKKAKTVPSAGKIMITGFWDSRGIIFTDYLEKGKITGQYADLLDWFDAELKKKRPHFAKKKVLFHHDNAPAHSPWQNCRITLRLWIVVSSLFSRFGPPYDFYLFPNMKKWLDGKRFALNEEIIAETEAYFKEFAQSYFLDGIKMLEYRWAKCIELKGDYVEK